MKILVTAFEPFGGESINPTMEIVSGLEVDNTLVLPVSFSRAPTIVIQAIGEMAPDAVILLGQVGGRAAISLERIAINMADAKNPDNDGYHPVESPIYENAPDAYISQMPLIEIRDAVRASGIPCHISNSAGTYVCNTLYYAVMHEFPSLPAIFVHVPYSPQQAVNKASTVPSMNVSDMVSAIRSIISSLERN